MQSFTTQSHQRNYQGNVVVARLNRPSLSQQRQQQRHKILTGIALSVLALAVAVTGSLLGATTIHNRQLKNQLHTLQTQDTQVVATLETAEKTSPDGTKAKPQNTLSACGQATACHRAPIANKHHDTQPLPSIDRNHTNPGQSN